MLDSYIPHTVQMYIIINKHDIEELLVMCI